MEKLEVKVVIPEKFQDETISNYYNKEEGTLTYEIGSNASKKLTKKVSDLIEDLDPRHIVKFNPILSILKDLNAIKDIKETGDKKADEKALKEANKFIRSFNGVNKKAKDTLKRPYIDMGKKIQDVYNLLNDESSETRTALENNFSNHIKNIEEEKKKKEEEAKAEELERIKQLEEKNKEFEVKLNEQKKIGEKSKIESTLKDILMNASSACSKYNKANVSKLKDVLGKTSFDDYSRKKDFDLSLFDDDEIELFSNLFHSQIKSSVEYIERFLSAKEEKPEPEVEAPKPEPEPEKPLEKPAEESSNTEVPLFDKNFLTEDGEINIDAIENLSFAEIVKGCISGLEQTKSQYKMFSELLSYYKPKTEKEKDYLEYMKNSAMSVKLIDNNIKFLENYED